MQRNAARVSLRQGAAPFRLLGRQVQHRQIARCGLQQAAAKLERVFLRGRSQLVNKAFREKRVVRMPHRTPKAHGHAHGGGHVRHVLVFEAIGQVKQALGRGFVGQVHRAGQ